MTIATDLADCACTNISLLKTISTCVQRSCSFADQNSQCPSLKSTTIPDLFVEVVFFASELCKEYPEESRNHELKTASIITIALAITSLSTRLYSRWLKTGRLWSDDAYAIVAAVSPRLSFTSTLTNLQDTTCYSVYHHSPDVS